MNDEICLKLGGWVMAIMVGYYCVCVMITTVYYFFFLNVIRRKFMHIITKILTRMKQKSESNKSFVFIFSFRCEKINGDI